MEFVKHIWEIVRKHNLFQPGQTIIIGLSGGPDSVALTNALYQINQRYNSPRDKWRLIIVHLNHKLRGKKSDRDEKFARKIAEKLNLPIYVERRDILKLSRKYKQSMEETARLERYDFFNDIARKIKKRGEVISITVGHNLDDNAETVLFRIIRGTGLKGLRAVLVKRSLYDKSPFWLVRPLVYVKRTEILDYLKREKLAYRIDATNKNRSILRNRIRHELIPVLKKYNPSIAEHLVQLSEAASENYDYIDSAARILMATCTSRGDLPAGRQALCPFSLTGSRLEGRGKKVSSLNLKALRQEHPVIQIELINRILEQKGFSVKKITFTHYSQLKRMIESASKYSELHLPEGVIVKTQGDKLTISKTRNPSRKKSV